MRTRMTAMALAVGLAACGGGDSPTASTPVAPPAPTKAVVTFNLDPKAQTAEYQGNGWYKFKVNMEFLESGGGGTGGVGYTINTTRITLVATPSNTILMDYDFAMAARVEANGRRVFQWTSPLYRSVFVTANANVTMVANITDDKGNSMTVSSAMTVKHVGGEKVELPQ